LELAVQVDESPMRRWPGKGLVRAAGFAWYDFADRWVPLQPFPECTFAGQGVLVSPPRLAGIQGELGERLGGPFDGVDPGCVWHRLFLDAQIPAGTVVAVRARASDDPSLLELASWIQQPPLYLRSGGAELPYHDPWADMRITDVVFPDR